MDKFPLQKQLLNTFQYDNSPVFFLNKVRRKYRNRFIELINNNQIRLTRIGECPCGSIELLKIAEKDRFGLPFNTLICSQCGLLITSPRIMEDDIPKYYKLIYHPLIVGTEKGETANTYSFGADQGLKIFEFVAPFLTNRSPFLHILEIGCADGYCLTSFAKAAQDHAIPCQLYGTEFEDHLKSEARKKKIEVLDEDIHQLNKKNLKFDLIIMSHVFEHMTDLNGILNDLKSVLSEIGILYIEVPGVMNLGMITQWYNSDFLDYLVHAHLYQFNLKSLQYVLSINGFKMLSGDEVVRAVFAKTSLSEDSFPSNGNCDEILNFLHNTYVRRRFPKKNLLKRLYWSGLSIFNQIYYPFTQEKPNLSLFL